MIPRKISFLAVRLELSLEDTITMETLPMKKQKLDQRMLQDFKNKKNVVLMD